MREKGWGGELGTSGSTVPGRNPFEWRATLRQLVMWQAIRHHFAGMEPTPLALWSCVMRSSSRDTNFGVRPFTICSMPGRNSWKTFLPASPPIVDPKLFNVSEVDRAQY